MARICLKIQRLFHLFPTINQHRRRAIIVLFDETIIIVIFAMLENLKSGPSDLLSTWRKYEVLTSIYSKLSTEVTVVVKTKENYFSLGS